MSLPEFPLLAAASQGTFWGRALPVTPGQLSLCQFSPAGDDFCCVAVTSFLSSGPLFLCGGLTRLFIQPICRSHQAADALPEAAAANGGERLLGIIWC